jgi:hypothetical protein
LAIFETKEEMGNESEIGHHGKRKLVLNLLKAVQIYKNNYLSAQ